MQFELSTIKIYKYMTLVVNNVRIIIYDFFLLRELKATKQALTNKLLAQGYCKLDVITVIRQFYYRHFNIVDKHNAYNTILDIFDHMFKKGYNIMPQLPSRSSLV